MRFPNAIQRRLAEIGGVVLLAWALPAWAEPSNSPGLTEPVFDVVLGLPVAGIISSENVREGDFVQTNQVILQLDNRLEELEVERRKLVLENRKADWESTRTVFEKSASVSRDELLKKEADYRVAGTEYETAVEQLRRRRLISPGSGIVAELKLHVGESCAAYEPVARIVDTRHCYFVTNMEAKRSAGLKAGQTVKLDIDEGGEPIRLEGKIIFVSPVVDAASGLQKVRVVFDNLEGKVRPGLAGRLILD